MPRFRGCFGICSSTMLTSGMVYDSLVDCSNNEHHIAINVVFEKQNP